MTERDLQPARRPASHRAPSGRDATLSRRPASRQALEPIPSRSRIVWREFGLRGFTAGSPAQIGVSLQLLRAEGARIVADEPIPLADGTLLVNFHVVHARPAEPVATAGPQWPRWPFIVAGLAVVVGLMTAVVVVASAIAANIGVIIVVVGLIALVGTLVRSRRLRHLLRIDIWG